MADESYEDYEKKMEAFVNEIPAFKAFRSEFARIGYNLSRSIKARKTNYITEEDLEYKKKKWHNKQVTELRREVESYGMV